MPRHLLSILITCLLFTSACNLINPKEQVPCYIQLDAFSYSNPDSNFTGSSTYNIPSAWVYADDQPVGTFDLPCTVPVLMSKNSKIKIVPAVYSQGMKSYLLQYPFYETDTTTLYFKPGEIQRYSPKTKYRSDITATYFKLSINFEEGILFRNLGSDTSMLITKEPPNLISGKNSGIIYLDQNKKTSVCISSNYFDYTPNTCFLEFDYKCTIPFQVGLQAEDKDGKTTSSYLMGLNPNTNANKIYLDLSTFIASNKSFTKFYIIIRSDVNDFDGKYKEGYVAVDNFKVISK